MEGTNCIISTKAMSTVDAVHLDIDFHQDAHWRLPLFLTYPNFQTFKLSRSLTKLAIGLSICLRNSAQKYYRATAFAELTVILGVGLRFSEHLIIAPAPSVAASTVVFSIHQPHWNIGTPLSNCIFPEPIGTENTASSPVGTPRDLSVPRLGSTASRFSSNATERT